MDKGGVILSNLLQMPNSESDEHYTASYKIFDIKSYLVRFSKVLPEVFIKYLTELGDLVVNIFGGSDTTGEVAESLGRHWVCCDMDVQYVAASAFRFLPKPKPDDADMLQHPYYLIEQGGSWTYVTIGTRHS